MSDERHSSDAGVQRDVRTDAHSGCDTVSCAFWDRWAQPEDGGTPPEVVQWLRASGFGVKRYIASGSFGSVVECARVSDGQRVAVKVVTWLDGRRDELEQELWPYKRLDDTVTGPARDFVVRSRWSGRLRTTVNGAVRWVGAVEMDLAHGSLGDIDTRRVSCPTALGLLADVLVGIRALHAAGVAVCDLKPHNILLFGNPVDKTDDRTGPPSSSAPSRARIADLGLCLPFGSTGLCGGSTWWTSVRDVDGWERHQHPASQGHDLFVFAKICVWLLTSMHRAAHVTTTARDGWSERFAKTGALPGEKSSSGSRRVCPVAEQRAAALLLWATTTIDAANAVYSGMNATAFAAADVIEAPPPGKWFDARFAPPGLRELFAARVIGRRTAPSSPPARPDIASGPRVRRRDDLFPATGAAH